jgi:hypothetical protein
VKTAEEADHEPRTPVEPGTPVEQFLQASRMLVNRQTNRLTKQLAVRVDPLSDRLRATSDAARSNDAEPLAAFVDRGAAYLEGVATYLEAADGERLIADLEARTRENPILVGALAFVAGMLVCRFLRSSRSGSAPS